MTDQRHGEVSERTVEEVVRGQLAKALGGTRGMAEAAVPTIVFTVTYLLGRRYGLGPILGLDELRIALVLGVGSALVLAAIRLFQRSSVQFVFNSLIGIGIASFFALRSGEAEDAFLPGIIYNAVYAAVLILSILIRWPAMGLVIGAVTGDTGGWRSDPAIIKLSSRLTWLLILPCVVRVVVQYPLWAGGMVGWLGVSKVLMGWPLQVAALAAMVWLLALGRTPMAGADAEASPGSDSETGTGPEAESDR